MDNISKIFIISLICAMAPSFAYANENEKIIYGINPVGVSTFTDKGKAILSGKTVNIVTFRTQVTGFDDTETIYSDPETSLPLRVERDIKWPFSKEFILEEYDQQKFIYTMKKYKGGKIVEENHYPQDGPIHNAILLPFYLRQVKDIKIGWTLTVRVPQEFKVTLSSVETVTVPAGQYKAYHFTSNPSKFEIWISQDEKRVPIRIKGFSGFNYTMSMKNYYAGVNSAEKGH